MKFLVGCWPKNHNKTNVTIVDRLNNNRPKVKHIRKCEMMKQYINLGPLVYNLYQCTLEIKRHIVMVRNAVLNLSKV